MNKAPSISPKGESPFPPHPSTSPKGESPFPPHPSTSPKRESPKRAESSPLGGIRGGLLRALEPEDLPLLYTIENDPEMWDVGATATPYSRHALRHHIQAMGADITESGELRFVIDSLPLIPVAPSASWGEHSKRPQRSLEVPPKGGFRGAPVGLIDLTNYDARALRAEVSIAVLREYREQGIGIEALRQLEEHCRRYLHLHQLYALVPEGNAASFSLFQSAGFTPVFDIPDWHFTNEKYIKVTFFQKIL